MYCNIITAIVQTNWGIPLNQCLFASTRTERNCSRVHEKLILLNLSEKQSIKGAETVTWNSVVIKRSDKGADAQMLTSTLPSGSSDCCTSQKGGAQPGWQ